MEQRYRIECVGNGAFYEITRIEDGINIFLQGEAAEIFGERLQFTDDVKYTNDDLCDEYFPHKE